MSNHGESGSEAVAPSKKRHRRFKRVLRALAVLLVLIVLVLAALLYNPVRTLATLRKVDDFPLYVMHYRGTSLIDLFAEDGFRSQTLTTVANTREISVAGLNGELAKKNVMIANGYGKLKEKTFRIAHMRDTTLDEIRQLLVWIEEIIKN